MKNILTFVSMIAVALSSWALNVGDTFNSSNGDYTYEVKVAATSSSAGKIAVKSYNNTTATSSKIALSLVGPDDKIYDINEIAGYAYRGRANITNITIGANIEYIGFEAFTGTSIKTLDIPSSVRLINIGFVRNCESLAEINVAEGNKKFATYDHALYTKDLTELHTMPAGKKSALYPSQLTSIGSYAFANSTMETIDIPYGVTKLMMMPFYYINSKAVVIPSSVKDFYVANDGSGPFWGRANLDEVDVYLNTTSVPIEKADEFATSSLRQDINLHVRRELASEFKSKWSGFKSINVDPRVGFDLSIGKLDFSINSTEPCTVNGAKYDGRASVVPGINYGNVSGENNIPFVLSIRGKYYAVTQIAVLTFSHSNATKFTGGENIDSVGYSSFNDCKNLTSVSLPNLRYIEQYAFKDCSSLTSFKFNKNLLRIRSNAFQNSGLTGDVVIPFGLTYLGFEVFSGTKVKRMFVPFVKGIEYEVFKGMGSLTELYLNMNLAGVSQMDFTGVPSTCALHVPYYAIDDYKADPVWNNAFRSITSGACDFTYGTNVSNAFSSPYRMNIISNEPFTEDGVEYAGTAEYVNYPGMGNLAKFMASSRELNQFYDAEKRYKMIRIGEHCFEGATNMIDPGIDKMTFLETIGDYAFNGLSAMTEIKIPAQVSYIGENAFAGCSKLTSIIAEPTTPPTVKANTLSNLYYQATLKVHNSCLAQYKGASFWKNFFKIESIEGGSDIPGDVDGNGTVDISDANLLINIVLGKESASKYNGRADVDGNGIVDVSDINA
ncbi:leucine-rich repeat protein, partial [Sodaliphilus sp.]|uniref:leucine-rich repeat protein n=1 Tax=Sodaliphilus sp. TaxID=2815818 RepID=UPI00388F9F15